MGKTMAQIKNNKVSTLAWYSDGMLNTEGLVAIEDRAVFVGDDYINGEFYRNGEKILTKDEQIDKAVSDADETIAALIEQIYLEDLEMIENV